MGLDDSCNTRLVLGLGLALTTLETPHMTEVPPVVKPGILEPSLTLSLSGQSYYLKESCITSGNKASEDPATEPTAVGGGGDQHSSVSSFSSARVKRERDVSGEDIEVEKGNSLSRISDEDDDGVNNTRKKLRLTKEQSALLEESFKQHITLNPKQKQVLARQLNLRPRQVEVWFQNRRARTKLKQTEVDCELLKKCCETLTDENRRLQKELQELKALNQVSQPFYMRMPPAMLTVCPSCERVTGAGGGAADVNTKSLFSLAPKSHHLFSPFANPSAAC